MCIFISTTPFKFSHFALSSLTLTFSYLVSSCLFTPFYAPLHSIIFLATAAFLTVVAPTSFPPPLSTDAK